MHSKSSGKIFVAKCCCIITKKEVAVKYLEKYQLNLKYCKNCNKAMDSNRIFCNHTCAATYNNLNRETTTKNKTKIFNCLLCNNIFEASIHLRTELQICKNCNPTKNIKIKIPKLKKIVTIKPRKIKYLFSKIKLCKCAHCGVKFVNRRQLKYCNTCKHLYCESNKDNYKFTFNIFKFPDLFDLKSLQQIGFYAPGGNSGRWNINGLSRDHKISVTDAIKNNYDSYYITHPLNCELMTHTANNKKKTNSSITYSELKRIVDEYNQRLLKQGSNL